MKIKKRLFDSIRNLLGTRFTKFFWRFRHIINHDQWANSYIGIDSLQHPHRKLLLEAIKEFEPVDSLLEIGCASGPNLSLLREKYPNAILHGIDISSHAIRVARQHFKNDRHTHLTVGDTDGLESIETKSIDVVFCDAILIYIGGESIVAVLKNMLRIAKKGIVLVEQMPTTNAQKETHNQLHDYPKLLHSISPHLRVSCAKIDQNIWPGNWGTHGFIISCHV